MGFHRGNSILPYPGSGSCRVGSSRLFRFRMTGPQRPEALSCPRGLSCGKLSFLAVRGKGGSFIFGSLAMDNSSRDRIGHGIGGQGRHPHPIL